MPRGVEGGFLDEFRATCSVIVASSEKNNRIWKSRKNDRWGEKRLAIIRGLKQLGILQRMPGGWDEYDVRDLDLLRTYLDKPPVSTYGEWTAFYKKMPMSANATYPGDVDSCFELLDHAIMETRDPEGMYFAVIERIFRRLKFLKQKKDNGGDQKE